MECFNSIRRRPLSQSQSQSSCHRQPGGSCNWAAVKGACNGRFLGPNCHFVCKFELWKCWAWKWEIAANNCWIRTSSSSRAFASYLLRAISQIYCERRKKSLSRVSQDERGVCGGKRRVSAAQIACTSPRPSPRQAQLLQHAPFCSTPTLIHATPVATLAPQRSPVLLTNARPIVAHPLTVDRSAVGGTSTYSLIHQNEYPFSSVPAPAPAPERRSSRLIYLQCRVAFAGESLIVLIGFVSSFRLHKIIVRKRVLLNWKICMSCLYVRSSTASQFSSSAEPLPPSASLRARSLCLLIFHNRPCAIREFQH